MADAHRGVTVERHDLRTLPYASPTPSVGEIQDAAPAGAFTLLPTTPTVAYRLTWQSPRIGRYRPFRDGRVERSQCPMRMRKVKPEDGRGSDGRLFRIPARRPGGAADRRGRA